MAIPDYQTLMRPVLEAARGGERKVSEVVGEMCDRFGLTEAEREELLPSGRQTVIANRTHWARTYLKQAGLLTSARRGHFEITELGRAALLEGPEQISSKWLEQFESFRDFKARSAPDGSGSPLEKAAVPALASDRTPDEELVAAHRKIDAGLAGELLDRARNASPEFFERILLTLLLRMGYGGSREEAGRSLGRSGDRGVDGVIDQDPLGVDQIYVQAKRYGEGNTVGAGDIRDFFGALNIRRASKGIFFTTSTFTAEAERTASDLGTRIVLIDGDRLARLMIRYGVGCETRQVLEIKAVDENFFDEEAL